MQHSGLTKERWSSFSSLQQILMIGNEMNRAKRLFSPPDKMGLKLCYERVLYLTDLTVQSDIRRGLRKEMLRWRDLVAGEYVSLSIENMPDINKHLKIFKSLLLLNPESAGQIAYLIT
ncbi:MAG: hypothetical protein HY279_04980 [Nitrospinae bacterium]|nr:hypothetical protein [Nitrospinota bacterium]